MTFLSIKSYNRHFEQGTTMINFNNLTSTSDFANHWHNIAQSFTERHNALDDKWLAEQRHAWQSIIANNPDDDKALTDWFIPVFNTRFADYNTILVRGGDEPEYLTWQDDEPAQIVFAHGYFSSALHEIAHWCIAGQERRKQDDFGYWYAPDGRTQEQQHLFEKVEIKPQAIECLFTLACGRKFFVSQDNLGADFDTSNSTFAQDVYDQAKAYLTGDSRLPSDAFDVIQMLLWCNGASLIKD